MKAVVQRVLSASVTVDGEVISSISRGLCVLVGIHRDDTRQQMEYVARKVAAIRLFDDEQTGKRWNKSAKDLGLEILCVSQFTLHYIMKGNKVDFHMAMAGDEANAFYAEFLAEVRKAYGGDADKVKDGRFGAMMKVDIANDGPVTIEIESPPPPPSKGEQKSTPAEESLSTAS